MIKAEPHHVIANGAPAGGMNNAKNPSNSLAEAVNAALVNDLDTLVVCIDENQHVVKFYGDTTKYLLQKNFNSNLSELLPKPLAVAFNTLSTSVLKTGKKANLHSIKIRHHKDIINVSLLVAPLILKKGEPQLIMVTFREDKVVARQGAEDAVFDEKIYHDQYTINIEEELKEAKEKLRSVYEQLDASNQSMQSFNEELTSANEEMQSTNEEMQSINEELDTINSSYQLKNKELLEINDDLNNYFRSNVNGQLIIDNDLVLVKFSPGTTKQVNLLESDIGRPISHITTNIKFETIIEDIRKVITDGIIITKEVETNNGKWYQVMTMPYIQMADNKRNGAIITFNDISELKKTQSELDKKNQSLLRINADLDNFTHTASHDLLAPLGNIEVSIGVMNRKVTDPDLGKFLTIINSSVKKFRALINGIATIAKLESDMIALELVDVEEAINNIEWSLDDKIKSSGALIIRDLELKSILFSKKNLRSILYNLISNGIKFHGDDRPVINIRTAREGDSVILSVQDNGIGIPKQHLDKIFDMYGRLHQDIEGHGIGLYLAKKIVDAAGGNIIVESEPGKGSKFIIHLKTEHEPATVTASLN